MEEQHSSAPVSTDASSKKFSWRFSPETLAKKLSSAVQVVGDFLVPDQKKTKKTDGDHAYLQMVPLTDEPESSLLSTDEPKEVVGGTEQKPSWVDRARDSVKNGVATVSAAASKALSELSTPKPVEQKVESRELPTLVSSEETADTDADDFDSVGSLESTVVFNEQQSVGSRFRALGDRFSRWARSVVAPAPAIRLGNDWGEADFSSVLPLDRSLDKQFRQRISAADRMKELDTEIGELSKEFVTRRNEVEEKLDTKIKERLDYLVSDALLGGPSQSIRDQVEASYEVFRSIDYARVESGLLTEKAFQEMQSRAVNTAAERWWNWGPLKYLPFISAEYKKLVAETRKYFFSADAKTALLENLDHHNRDGFDENFNTYRYCFGEDYITRQKFDYVFGKKEAIIALSQEMNPLEEVARLSGKIDQLEKQFDGEIPADLQEHYQRLVDQRAELLAELQSTQPHVTFDPVFVPAKETKPRTEQEQFVDQWGDLAQPAVNTTVEVGASSPRFVQ